MSSNKKNKKELLKQVTNYVLIAGFALTIVFLVMMVFKISGGVAKTVDTPDIKIRLQVTHNDPPPENYQTLISSLDEYTDSQLEIHLIDSELFDLRPIAQTMVISREADRLPAQKLSELLGLNPDDVIYKPLENNYDQISVTLVVGEDLNDLAFFKNESEEK